MKYFKNIQSLLIVVLIVVIFLMRSCSGKGTPTEPQIIRDTIVESFIIEKTYHNRLSVPNNSEWISALSIDYTIEETWRNKLEKVFSKEETETLINFQYYFSPKKLYEKNSLRSSFVSIVFS